MQIKARAKINLFFQITGKRSDGYHLMESLVVFADDVYDLIEISESEENSTSIVGGEFASLLIDEKNNLIDKALEAFTADIKYHCALTKNIPIGAGLGGGSSDAAMAAKFLSPNGDIIEELLKIGADLPICYHAEPAFCGGIGEIIDPVQNFPKIYMVLVNPKKTLLTKDVFKNNLRINTASIGNKPMDFSNNVENIIDFLMPLTNDLTEAAIHLMPEIKDILRLLESQDGCYFSRMSGSGPTCFALFKDKTSAILAMKAISIKNPNYWVKHTTI